ncbi:Uncharacterized protein Adt_42279 [Abeliophyllum distichum]|uniref:Uncharacterized protein n=1 Tax=Abeliophyllum distichum TaxID=126358 RepID=A0ABD1PR83_9LAMI
MAPLKSLERDYPLIDSIFQNFYASHGIFTVEEFLIHDLYMLAALAEQHNNSEKLKQKEKKAEEETNKILAQLRAELVVSNELQQKLERKVNFIESENALLENRQKELKETINNLLQSRESFVKAYELSGFPNTKKDGTAQATKLIQPVLKLLDEDSSDVFWVEAAITIKIMSGKCSASVLKKLGNALCLLPKLKGDEDSWSLMMQKILLSINTQLNDAFQGLEEEARSKETMRILLPPGKEPLQPLGGQAVSQETSDVGMRKPEQLLFHYGVFFAYMRLREQEIRNLMWISECVAQNQKSRVHDSVVFIF